MGEDGGGGREGIREEEKAREGVDLGDGEAE